jgi:hypothetical protein
MRVGHARDAVTLPDSTCGACLVTVIVTEAGLSRDRGEGDGWVVAIPWKCGDLL